ncbi:MAG: hypothetical protein ACKPKO_28565, partial [Candidatus Fonsibacter sp.]
RSTLKHVHRQGLDPHDQRFPVVMGIDDSKPHWMQGLLTCLTCSRVATGHYTLARGRRLTVKERLQLQGLALHIQKRSHGHFSDRQLGAMIGNSWSSNVMQVAPGMWSHALAGANLSSVLPRLALGSLNVQPIRTALRRSGVGWSGTGAKTCNDTGHGKPLIE